MESRNIKEVLYLPIIRTEIALKVTIKFIFCKENPAIFLVDKIIGGQFQRVAFRVTFKRRDNKADGEPFSKTNIQKAFQKLLKFII